MWRTAPGLTQKEKRPTEDAQDNIEKRIRTDMRAEEEIVDDGEDTIWEERQADHRTELQGDSLILTKCNGLPLCPESIYRAMKGVQIPHTM